MTAEPMPRQPHSTPPCGVEPKGDQKREPAAGAEHAPMDDVAPPAQFHRPDRPTPATWTAAAVKARVRIEDEIRSRGITLVASGTDRSVGRCPFHTETTPSFTVYTATQTCTCFGCGFTGDVITFVQHLDGLSFREALRQLGAHADRTTPDMPASPRARFPDRSDRGSATGEVAAHHAVANTSGAGGHRVSVSARSPDTLQPEIPESLPISSISSHDEQERQREVALSVATALYAQRLQETLPVLYYLESRGVTARLARDVRLGYADGTTLRSYVETDSALHAAAAAAGLVNRGGREALAQRLVIPEVRRGRTVQLIARMVPPVFLERDQVAQAEQHPTSAIKYLGSRGRKGLLGYGLACEHLDRLTRDMRGPGAEERAGRIRARVHARYQGILVVEGALDWVIAVGWKLPVLVVALLAARISATQREELADLHVRSGGLPVIPLLDADAPGRTGAEHLSTVLTQYDIPLAQPAPFPEKSKDIGDLGPLHRVGRAQLIAMLTPVLNHLPPDAR